MTIGPNPTLIRLDVPRFRKPGPNESRRDTLRRVASLARRQLNKLLQMAEYRYSHRSFAVRDALLVAEAAAGARELGTFGVEYIQAGQGERSPAIDYLNAGDTYSDTVLYYNGRFQVGCWGDIVERGNYE